MNVANANKYIQPSCLSIEILANNSDISGKVTEEFYGLFEECNDNSYINISLSYCLKLIPQRLAGFTIQFNRYLCNGSELILIYR